VLTAFGNDLPVPFLNSYREVGWSEAFAGQPRACLAALPKVACPTAGGLDGQSPHRSSLIPVPLVPVPRFNPDIKPLSRFLKINPRDEVALKPSTRNRYSNQHYPQPVKWIILFLR
jgi:hypothetical protein